MKVVSSILKARLRNNEALLLLGLGPDLKAGLPDPTWPHYKVGQAVQLIAKSGAWRFKCKSGATGVVVKFMQASVPPEKSHAEDLYRVELDSPKSVKESVHLTYKELKPL